jgi:hypothetical protein
MMESHGVAGQIEDDAWDVSNEMAHLRIVKDIRDELHMVKRVISEQEDVVQSLYGKAEKRKSSGSTSKITLQDEDQLLESMHLRLRKVDKLEREALMVEQRVSFTTTLSPCVNEALVQRSPRSKAEARQPDGSERHEEAGGQG